MGGFSIVYALVLALRGFSASAQDLSDTSGWALRGNQTCPSGESTCGRTAGIFVACCPSASPCLSQKHDICCPPNSNCTNALVNSGPQCTEPTWILCENYGYFCCLPGQTCYSSGGSDGCAYPGYKFAPGETAVSTINQVRRPTATSSSSPSATSSPTAAAQASSGGLKTSDKIAIGIGVPIGVATVLATWLSWRLYQRKKRK